jgi:hypothetical protein
VFDAGGEERSRWCRLSDKLLSSSFMFDDEFGDRDEVDNEDDSIGPPNSISSVLTEFRYIFLFDE